MPLQRRDFHRQLAAVLAATMAGSGRAAPQSTATGTPAWEALEQSTGGRFGVAVLHANGQLDGHRLDERFPMCSTFKWLAGAHVLHRVDQGQERLDRRVRFGREVLLPYSPVTSQHLEDGMTVGELCHAAITTSDNAAGNLLLASLGGPDALTRHLRDLGDAVTRLDRWEPDLNEARPGDVRDTSSPRAMARLLHATLAGEALSPRSSGQLAAWLEATTTNGQRLRSGLPPGWRMGSKTGTGARGTTNDVGIFWPPGQPPVCVAVFLTESDATEPVRNGAVAAVARRVTARG